MSLTESEFAALRRTIAIRGTVRVALVPFTLLGWGALGILLLAFLELPIAVMFPLALLAGGFEAVHALHVGVERIGRYLQVFYEGPLEGPRWESTAMAVGPALPGGGADPLFAAVFIGAALINLLPALLSQATPAEWVVLAALHLAFALRVIRARGAATRQRAVELERFRALKSQPTPTV